MKYIRILAILLFLGEVVGLRAEVSFEKEILPVLAEKCLDCHSAQKGSPKAGLRLDTAEGILGGSKKNKILTPGNVTDSLLIKLVSLPNIDPDIMPPEGKGDPLTGQQILLLRQWIKEGANFGGWTAYDFAAQPVKSASAGPAASQPNTAQDSKAEAPKSDGKMAWQHPSTITPETNVKAAAAQIDQLVEANYRTNKITPKPVTNDATFLRRVYLDAAGRIPTHDEAVAFLESDSPTKRADLINSILTSEAYVSRQYDYWAEVLRVQSRLRQVSGENYQQWIKDSIRDEMPYDEFVRKLITAEGHIYENGASGYYIRDNGMPLDNMANTVQIFLGTSLACAQCHNHPFDKWTQKEFYEMSAFTYGVQTVRPGSKEDRIKYKQLAGLEIDNRVKQVVKNMVRQTRFGFVSDDDNKALRLPDDYKYTDAEPKSKVAPDTIFGNFADRSGSPRVAYADWLTSRDNSRFTVVIANRLWRQAMGLGLIEPHDDMKDDTMASNPDLMAYLVELMKKLDYNQKDFLRIVYNTQTYQRESVVHDPTSSDPFHFPGPVMRRMTAEQLWDSVLTLIVPDLDARTAPEDRRYGRSIEEIEAIRNMSAEELLRAAEAFVERGGKGKAPRTPEMELKMESENEMQSPEPSRRASKKSARTPSDMAASKIVLAASGKRIAARRSKNKASAREQEFPKGFLRASEVQQPAPPGHFLEEFGQSDREVIEGSRDAATVTQILNLMNGPAYAELAKSRSVLSQTLRSTGQTPSDLADAIFLSIYGDRPTDQELSIATEALARDPKNGLQDLTWALLNTQRFMFIR